MLVYKGLGCLVPLISFICMMTVYYAATAATGNPNVYSERGWPIFVSFVLAALIVWPVGVLVNRKRLDSEVTELLGPGAQQTVVKYVDCGHTFFWIPVQYWPPLLVLAGIIYGLKNRA